MLQDQAFAKLQSFEELLPEAEEDEGDEFDLPGSHAGPQQQIEREHFIAALGSAIGQLPQREQLVLSLYYDEELNLKEIAAVLGVTESRISQIISQAALRLRARLSSWRSS
jgi:RNA polymerase sigma factor for flagellar operon FliA